MSNNTRCAIYIRVSTQEQATEGYSIQEQTERLKKYCEAHDWTVVKVYTDPGFSGANMDRPALKQLFSDIQKGSFNTILVYKLDRLSRSQKDTMYIIEDLFLKNGIDFISMNENFDTSTPFGRAMIGILSVFAQLERDQIKERLMMGHVGRAKTGLWNGGQKPPIGYDYKDGELIINEYEAMQVRLIFDLFINGLDGEQVSMNTIAKHMQERYTNRYSSWNKKAAIGLILKNPLYTGMIKYGGVFYPGKHEPIVSNETFEIAQKKYDTYIKNFSKSQRNPFQGRNLLSGLLYCGHCGARYYTALSTRTRKSGEKARYAYYACYSKYNVPKMKKADSCQNLTYKRDVLNQRIIDEICGLQLNPEEVMRLREVSIPETDNTSEIIQNRISEIEKQAEKLLDLYQHGLFDIEKISSRMEELNAERDKLQSDLEFKKVPAPQVNVKQALEIIQSAADVFQYGSPDEQQALVRSLINKIIIDNDNIEIHWTFCL
ncbi:recombinase family protein [Lacrimispora sp. 38-1]|uniref:recombinase family protein n=1 Tax=Lacrimispora sp. 38-1 TaxID=3125778 RepID=UPI003CF83305